MYAITFYMSACGRMKSGMLGCGFRSQTASARSVMPGKSATIWKLGIVVASPVLDQHLRLPHRREDLAV